MMVISLGPDLEAALKELARKEGVDPETLVLNILRERFLSQFAPVQPRDEWERQLLAIATDCGVALSNEAVSSQGLYE
jgi:hypothetical protein